MNTQYIKLERKNLLDQANNVRKLVQEELSTAEAKYRSVETPMVIDLENLASKLGKSAVLGKKWFSASITATETKSRTSGGTVYVLADDEEGAQQTVERQIQEGIIEVPEDDFSGQPDYGYEPILDEPVVEFDGDIEENEPVDEDERNAAIFEIVKVMPKYIFAEAGMKLALEPAKAELKPFLEKAAVADKAYQEAQQSYNEAKWAHDATLKTVVA